MRCLFQVFWEVFASNITHCEVETREKLPEVASSSAAMNQPSDQRLWGGDAGHWIAIRELGKLAMVFNTLDNGTAFFNSSDPQRITT